MSSSSEYKLLAGTGVKALSRGSDYREWRLAVIDILAEKGYWDLISTAPEESASSDTTIKEKSAKARGLLGRLLDSNHRELYATERDPHKLWAKLESRYAGKDQARIWYLRSELANTQFEGEPMVDYISKLEKLFNQLAGAGEIQKEKDKIYALLSNLPTEYHPFRTLISNNPNFADISYDHVCDRFILEHQQLTGVPTESPSRTSTSTSAFVSSQRGRGRMTGGRNGRGRGYSSRGPNITLVGTSGRSQARGMGNEKGSSASNTSVDQDSCLYCKEKGHWIRNCPKKQRGQHQQFPNSAHTAHTRKTTAIAWMANKESPRTEDEWILDSGASHHMSSQRQYFSNFREYATYIHIANGARLTAAGVGDIWLAVEKGNHMTTEIQLREVLYVPDLGSQNLVSVRCIQQAGASVVFSERDGQKVEISKNNETIAWAELRGNSYILLAGTTGQKNDSTANRAITASTSATLIEWHHRLGQLGFDDVKALAKKNSDITITGTLTNPTCEHCLVGKQIRKPKALLCTRYSSRPGATRAHSQ